jgi:hypothetical protein
VGRDPAASRLTSRADDGGARGADSGIAADPCEPRPGHGAGERTGVVHWWKNESDRPARALVVDIVDAAAR